MALPDNFSEFEHLQSTLLKVHNRFVREEFSDIESEDVDLNAPRSSLRHASLFKDNDTCDMMIMRMNLFYFALRQARDLQPPIYGIPLDEIQATRKFKPQITLYFKEDDGDVEEDYRPVWGEVSFRLMNESSTTITRTELTTLATKIKTEFGTGNGYIWKKGKKYFHYTEKEKGYQFQILARTEQDAKALVNKVLDIQTDTPDWQYFKTVVNDEETAAYPYTPGNQTILGKTHKKPRRRPNVDVRFQYATADIWGLTKPITLFDRTGTFIDALVD